MTLRNPSSTSLSFRLSSSFLICAVGIVLRELRELRADWAASRVSSRAGEQVSVLLWLKVLFRVIRRTYRSPASWIS